jgi:hypothetical protein
MRTDSGTYIEELSCKQLIQLIKMCGEFQPYAKVDTVVFLEVVTAARIFCDRSRFGYYNDSVKGRFDDLFIEQLIREIKDKYYFNGLKYTNRILTDSQVKMIYKINKAPKIRLPDFGSYNKHDSTEKELFMKVVRACRDYMRAKMSKEAEPELFQRLKIVHDAL